MRIVESTKAGMRVRTDLARLSEDSAELFLTTRDVRDFLKGRIKLDHKTSNVINTANKAMLYVEKFAKARVRVRRVDHVVALLCLYSEDSFGTRVLSPEFHTCLKALQEQMDDIVEGGYSGLKLALRVMDFVADNDFLYNKSPAPIYLLYNFLLHQDGYALVLEDTDQLDATLPLNIRYKVHGFAKGI